MSNVFKQFINQIARPSQAVIYGQNDGMSQIFHQIFASNNNPSVVQHQYQAQPIFASDNYQIINPHQNPFKVSTNPIWIQNQHFIKDNINDFNHYFQYQQNEGDLEEQDYENASQNVLENQETQEKYQKLSHHPEPQAAQMHYQNVNPAFQYYNKTLSDKCNLQSPAIYKEINHVCGMGDQQYNLDGQEDYSYSQSLSHQDPSYQDQSTIIEQHELKIKKPKKNFASKEEQTRYVEGFKSKYKTEICKNWQLTGFCIFQDNCSFAHGINELNTKVNVPKNYKTKLCKRFHEDLYCPYGARCQFKHQTDENAVAAAPPQIQKQSKQQKEDSDLQLAQDMVNQELKQYDSQQRKRLQIFEKITFTKTNKKKSRKLSQQC